MSITLPFPHPDLTRIDGKPTNRTVQVLQRELFTNARSVVSTRGGGTNGHLALLMSPAAFTTRSGVEFVPPQHPGAAPVHATNATAGQITETNRQFSASLMEHSIYQQVSVELKKQILAAIQPAYLWALEDADFGFADVTPYMLLTHLHTTYGSLTPEDLELNRLTLSDQWNPDAPIEELWCRIKEARRIATAAHDDITENATINLTLTMFEKSGLLADATRAWRLQPTSDWTLARFTNDITAANRERLRQTTARSVGYHSARAAVPASQQADKPPTDTKEYPLAIAQTVPLFYCWTHGLGPSRTHTSATCINRADGHIATATFLNTEGGNMSFKTIRGSGTAPRRAKKSHPGTTASFPNTN